MEKYKRFCRVCCGTLDSDSYVVMKGNGQLTKVGEAMEQISELVTGEEEGIPRVCKPCYRLVIALKKADDDLAHRKRELNDKVLVRAWQSRGNTQTLE